MCCRLCMGVMVECVGSYVWEWWLNGLQIMYGSDGWMGCRCVAKKRWQDRELRPSLWGTSLFVIILAAVTAWNSPKYPPLDQDILFLQITLAPRKVDCRTRFSTFSLFQKNYWNQNLRKYKIHKLESAWCKTFVLRCQTMASLSIQVENSFFFTLFLPEIERYSTKIFQHKC